MYVLACVLDTDRDSFIGTHVRDFFLVLMQAQSGANAVHKQPGMPLER
jgi:hypothetical protein